MTLEQLRVFVAVAEREHMTEAAKVLHLTQSATSAAIAALEERHDIRLFDRVGRRIELTDAGRIFLDEARAVLLRAEEAAIMLSELTGLRRGTLRIAASQTIGNYWLPKALHRFHQAYPGIDLQLTVTNTRGVEAGVSAGTSDLGFVEDHVGDSNLTLTAVATDELVLIVAPSHPLAASKAVGSRDLLSMSWVVREPGSGTRRLMESALKQGGVLPERLAISLELPSNEAVCAAVGAGSGASILSSHVVAAGLQAGTLRVLPFAVPARQFYAVRHRQRHQSRAAKAFLDLVASAFPFDSSSTQRR